MTNTASPTPSEFQPAETTLEHAYYGLYGHYWKASRDIPPTKWLPKNKKLCACDDHQSTQWPMDHAVITVPPCAYKCPYCPKFDTLGTTDPQVVKLRGHIKRDHLKKNPHEFPGLTVTPGRVTKARAP
ncbi:uncharacterized protein N7500_007372 [Penicillium coprophilum]|uniref:uncharacterized protein n=1 Tax=Penicillium coprophilum TaxID=36646 RepID=UPI0023928115|nr:uncharacterized protein N7500_007372 [Penicillium coprophilum]KAJ5165542.1 hypothetical protein N7500_007372 [Penicillium coprophilum]